MSIQPPKQHSVLLEKIKALEERQRHLVDLIDSARDAVLEMGRDGIITGWNRGAERILGWSPAEAIGRRMSELIVPECHRAAHERGFAAYLATRKERVIGRLVEIEALHKSGVMVAIELSIFTLAVDGELAFGAFIRDISQRRSAEQALRLSEERYRAVVEHVDEGMIVIKDERVVYANTRAAEIAGMSVEDMRQVGFLHRIHPDDHELVLGRQRSRLAGEDVPSRYELRLLMPDGTTRWIGISVSVVPWDGAPAILTFFSDISARKLLEGRLRDTLEQRETILESSLVGIAFLTDQGRVHWANRSMARIFGASAGATGPFDWEALFGASQDPRQVWEEINRTVESGQTFERDLQMRRLDGSTFWVTASGKAVSLLDKTRGSVWTVMDITHRKQLEEALERTSSEREAIFASALVGICFNVNRRMQWVNDKFVEMTGYSRAELVGQSSRLLYDSEEKFLLDGQVTRRQLEQDGSYVVDRQLFRRNGEAFWVQLAGRCVHGHDPSKGVIWTLLDITERIASEDRMRAALTREKELNELRSRFVSMTSHEFRTPLAAILSAGELLRDFRDRMPGDEQLELLDNIAAGVKRMTGMLDRVLLISQADAQMLDFRPIRIDLAALCREIGEEASASQGGEPRLLVVRIAPELDDQLFDPKLLRHIFSNLLSNALKYSSPSTEVNFDVARLGGRTVFTVDNQGIGIPADELSDLFGSFHRGSNVGEIPGTGLGLSIVKKSVELHGGSIEVQSETGGLTRFTVTL